MKPSSKFGFGLTLLLAPGVWAQTATLPTTTAALPAASALQPTWHQEPLGTISATRAQVVLNGLWKFQPATAGAEPQNESWGLIPVPGAWGGDKSWLLPNIVKHGQGAMWQTPEGVKVADYYKGLSRGWYERPLAVPASFTGRRITLDFAKISTDARVFINGAEVGRISSPYGTVDISKFVTPGQTATLRVLVIAAGDNEIEQVFMGTAEGQAYTAKAVLETKGITGDVLLKSEPLGARISDVFVQPSTRKNTLGIDVELTDVKQRGTIAVTARLIDEKGVEEKRFNFQAGVKSGDQTLKMSFPWTGARLWDLDKPNLYTLKLSVGGAGISDEYAQEFGFREFWIDGTRFMLNGAEFRLRPTVLGNEANQQYLIREEVDGIIDAFRSTGFNIQEFWPKDRTQRGAVYDDALFVERAARKGWPIIATLPDMAGVAATWSDPLVKIAYERKMATEIKRYRNNPAVVAWVHSPNRFGNWQDQNPRFVGNKARLSQVEEKNIKILPAALDANALIRQYDPTRPVTTHQGGVAGDFQMTNNYLNFIPWQEQEEWLSDWRQNGDVPYMPVEFGFILDCDTARGRNTGGWGRWGATATEALATEYLAIFYGADAYGKETPRYRDLHAQRLFLDEKLVPPLLLTAWKTNPGQVYKSGFKVDPLALQMQSEVAERNYRAWRTMGTTGGMILWDFTFSAQAKGRINVGPFVPGRRGAYREFLNVSKLKAGQPEAESRDPELIEAMKRANSDTLAYICGPEIKGDIAAFTAKDHSFASGAKLQKRVALLNDTCGPQAWNVSYRVTAGGKVIGSGTKTGTIKAAQTNFVPLELVLPKVTAKTDAQIVLNATVGARKHTDAFAFRVFPNLAPAKQSVTVFDPQGQTTALLKQLGYSVSPWKGGATPNLLVIGREALSKGTKTPSDLQNFVRSGGRLLMMQQHPDYLRKLGFRVGVQVRREIYPVDAAHPIASGLDAKDMRDWSGHSTLVEAKREISDKEKSSYGYPVHGWKWGNRGGVSSAMIEKPHRAGWRPLLEGDFDLAYSPLMELDFGRGRITLCTLDLEDHASKDPAAAKLGANILRHARVAPFISRAQNVSYLGGSEWQNKLEKLGLQFQTVSTVPTSPGLLIVSPAAPVDEAALAAFAAFAAAGGKVVMLADEDENGLLGARFVKAENFAGSINVPVWNATAGLSPSDLRFRAPRPTLVAQGASDVQIGADGLLARRAVGKGEIIWAQLDPDRFEADKLTYFRFTRWRQTRALSQILANLGASFRSDAEVFTVEKPLTKLSLAGPWKAVLTAPLPTQPATIPDPGISGAARAAVAANYDDAALPEFAAPGTWEKYHGAWSDANGEAVFRRTIEVPAAWAGKDLLLSLGTVDDFETTFWNGEEIGNTPANTINSYAVSRRYTVAGALVKAGKNLISTRVFDALGDGGFTALPADFNVSLVVPETNSTGFYHPDYRADFALGDDPHRYYRW